MIYQDPDFKVRIGGCSVGTVIVRLPESGKHPKHVLDMADELMIQAVEQKKQLCIHTHSEHLMLRMLRRIRESTHGEVGRWPGALREAFPEGIRPSFITVLHIGQRASPSKPSARVSPAFQALVDEIGRPGSGPVAWPWPPEFIENMDGSQRIDYI